MSTLLLVGTGLIGGSFALAARKQGLFDNVAGIDLDPGALADAMACGVIDGTELQSAPAAICVAVPTSQIAGCVAQMAARHAGVPIFDVGSVKIPIIESLRAGGELPARYVPCHPVAGSEQHGARAARADLFEHRSVVITPVAETDRTAVDTVAALWRAIGAHVSENEPEVHDRIVAVTSHLPNLLAFALMEVVAEIDDADMRVHAGTGFRDFSRIAGSDPAVWSDILHENRESIRMWASKLIERLTIDEDKNALEARIANARTMRSRLDDG